jgi:hypothetical protein
VRQQPAEPAHADSGICGLPVVDPLRFLAAEVLHLQGGHAALQVGGPAGERRVELGHGLVVEPEVREELRVLGVADEALRCEADGAFELGPRLGRSCEPEVGQAEVSPTDGVARVGVDQAFEDGHGRRGITGGERQDSTLEVGPGLPVSPCGLGR